MAPNQNRATAGGQRLIRRWLTRYNLKTPHDVRPKRYYHGATRS
jgi:hypothetical protein